MEHTKKGLANPFAEFNASLMDDDEIIKYWIQPQILFGQQAVGVDLTGIIPVIVMGGRGTGKTMLLKYLSNEVQIKMYSSENAMDEDFLRFASYIGVYYRFDGPTLSSFKDRKTDQAVWDIIFGHYFEIVIGQKFIAMLINLKENNFLNIDSNCEKNLVSEILNLIDPKYDVEVIGGTFQSINCVMQEKSTEVSEFINDTVLCDNIKFHSRPIISSGKLIFGIPKILAKNLSEFNDKKFIILLDEYENLLMQQQKIINTLIKHVQHPVTFRIGTRLYGIRTYDTLNDDEFLMEDADYRKILFENILISSEKAYKDLLKEIARKRLEYIPEFNKRDLIDIESLLGTLTPSEEARRVVYGEGSKDDGVSIHKKCKHVKTIANELERRGLSDADIKKTLPKLLYQKNPLIEMLNLLLLKRDIEIVELIKMFSSFIDEEKSQDYIKYKELYGKNELGLLFQLLSLYRPKQKMYAGFDVFSMLSSGITRNFLELCYQSFNFALFSEGNMLLDKGKISFKNQTSGAETRAEKFLENIERIPEYGNAIKSLVTSLGAIFYAWHRDPRLREPEATYFCTDKSSLSDDARNILETAVQWSVLQQKKPMKGKRSYDRLLDVYALNHILAPHFTVSYRIRGRIPEFSKSDIETLLSDSQKDIDNTIKKLGRWTDIDKKQLKLFDF